MRRWFLLLGAPSIWAAHFLAVYAAASVSALGDDAIRDAARIAISLLTIGALAACGFALALALRQSRSEGFWRTVAIAGAVFAIVAILWQTLPALMPLDGTAPGRLS